jgi:hypothetical protein
VPYQYGKSSCWFVSSEFSAQRKFITSAKAPRKPGEAYVGKAMQSAVQNFPINFDPYAAGFWHAPQSNALIRAQRL